MSEQPEYLGRILVVDDEEIQRASIAQELNLWGFLVETATGGAEALARLQLDPLPDLVILDLMMPYMDGLQVRDRMLQVKRLSQIPVILKSCAANDAAKNLEWHIAFLKDTRVEGLLFTSPPLSNRPAYVAVLNVLARRGAMEAATRAEEASQQEANSPPLVYIADGDPLIREQISRSLQSAGYQTLEASSGTEVQAETSGRTVRPDAIICGVDVPRMDAFELREYLLADRKLRYVPFIVLAERPDDEAAFFETMSHLDYDAFLLKPLTPDTPIVPVLENVLRRRRPDE